MEKEIRDEIIKMFEIIAKIAQGMMSTDEIMLEAIKQVEKLYEKRERKQ